MVLQAGFIKEEAIDQLNISWRTDTAFSANELIGSPPPLDGWELFNQSEQNIPPFNSFWQIWQYKGAEVPEDTVRLSVGFRGTTVNLFSIEADLLALMFKARAVLGNKGSYNFAGYNTLNLPPNKSVTMQRSAVHIGFALTAISCVENSNLLESLQNAIGGKKCELFITGHSQGAAVATLFRSLLEYNDMQFHLEQSVIKSYVFAQPKPGNDYYAYDLGMMCANEGMFYTLNSSLDFVPQVPLTIQSLLNVDLKPPVADGEVAEFKGFQELVKKSFPNPADIISILTKLQSPLDSSIIEKIMKLMLAFYKQKEIVALIEKNIDFQKIPLTLNYTLAGSPIILQGELIENPYIGGLPWGYHMPSEYMKELEKLGG